LGYLHIPRLESDTRILQFRHVYATEKIHGTSAHVKWAPNINKEVVNTPEFGDFKLTFFSGGESYDKFVALFDVPALEAKFCEKFDREVTIYGEAYGGKQQGMSATYGPNLKFVVFDIQVGSSWLDVPKAHDLATSLGFEFVDYSLVPTSVSESYCCSHDIRELWDTYGEISAIVVERKKPSTQAKRNGIVEDKLREGIVLRPPFEVTLNNGGRLIAKFKNPEFSERKSNPTKFSPEKQAMIADAQNVAFEFVTPMRLEHVINRLISERDDKNYSIKDTKKIIDLMVEDVEREGSGEFTPGPAIRKAIGAQTVKLFKQKLEDNLREQVKVAQVIGVLSPGMTTEEYKNLEGKSDA